MTQTRCSVSMNTVCLILGCLILLLGCSSSEKPSLDPMHESGLLQNQRINVADEIRNFHLYLPDHPGSASIVFLFHGNGGSSDQILGITGGKSPYKIWMDTALKENIILVVPDGSIGSNGKQGWNDCRIDALSNPESDDVLFISSLLDQVKNIYSTSTARVFAVGTSNGGQMVMRLSDELPEKFNAIAIVAASKPVNTRCVDSSHPLPVLVMNGTNDPVLPYDGGQISSNRGEVFSTSDTINFWIDRNQTALIPVNTRITDVDQLDGSRIQRYSYSNGIDGTSVEHYEVINGGHTEPSVQERYSAIYKLVVGNQNGDLEMAEEIWNFFKSF